LLHVRITVSPISNDNQRSEENTSSALGEDSKQVTQSADNRPRLQKEGSFVLQKEDSFIRTGSGRKLPKVPQRSVSASSGLY
jgi:hypothetical protein